MRIVMLLSAGLLLPMSEPDSRIPRLRWLLVSRWLVYATQVVLLMLAESAGGFRLPMLPIIIVIAVAVASNLALAALVHRCNVSDWILAGTIAFDIVVLTVELWFSGGPANPFTALYLVYISFAASVLGSRWTWGLVGLASIGYAVLYWGTVEIPLAPADHATQMRVHLQGMWLAFLVAAVLIGYAVTYVQRLIARQGDELRNAILVRERSQHLTALATLAAGAAHELATPLSTIAVVAKEFEHRLRLTLEHRELAEDAATLREQVRRCRTVLDRLATQANQDDGANRAAVGEVVAAALSDLERAEDVEVTVSPALLARSFPWSHRALSVSLRNVVQNALDASPRGSVITIAAHEDIEGVVLEVRDRGEGMDATTLSRAAEPFYSTKAGGGMGLGLFLTKGLIEQLGARLELSSSPGHGTTVRFTFPTQPVHA